MIYLSTSMGLTFGTSSFSHNFLLRQQSGLLVVHLRQDTGKSIERLFKKQTLDHLLTVCPFPAEMALEFSH